MSSLPWKEHLIIWAEGEGQILLEEFSVSKCAFHASL